MQPLKDMLDFLGWPYKALILFLLFLIFALVYWWNRD